MARSVATALGASGHLPQQVALLKMSEPVGLWCHQGHWATVHSGFGACTLGQCAGHRPVLTRDVWLGSASQGFRCPRNPQHFLPQFSPEMGSGRGG